MNPNCKRKTVNIYLSIRLNISLGPQKNRLIETVLLSTHNIYFGLEISPLVHVRACFILYCWFDKT